MTHAEAMDYVERGFSVRRHTWNDESRLNEVGVYVGNRPSTCAVSMIDMGATDWTLHTVAVSNAELNRRSQEQNRH